MVKNVTGYDLCKLIAGSYGTLSVLTEITLKVMPRPETARTILVHWSDDAGWQDVLAEGSTLPMRFRARRIFHPPSRGDHRSPWCPARGPALPCWDRRS